MFKQKRIIAATLAALMSISVLPSAVSAEAELCETARLDFDEENVFTGANGFSWSVTGSKPEAADGFGAFAAGSVSTATLPKDYTYDGKIRVELRVKNDVAASSSKKTGYIQFRNGSTDILVFQIRPNGDLRIQAGTGSGTTVSNITESNVSDGEFYTYVVDFDFTKQLIDVAILNNEGTDIASEKSKGIYFYRNNKADSIDSIQFSKSGGEGTMLVDYLAVLQELDNEQAAERVLEKISIDNADGITEDFTLPKYAEGGYEISWVSENSAIEIIDNGEDYTAKVTRPNGANAEGALVCTVTKDGISASKEFDTTVILVITDEVKAKMDADAIAVKGDYVTEDVVLPTVGSIYGSEIEWSVEQNDYVRIVTDGNSVTAAVTRPTSSQDSKTVILTAKVKQNGEVCEKRFALRVVKQSETIINDKYSECGFVTNAVDGFTSVRSTGDGYPKMEYDEILGEDCLVFLADSAARSECYRVVPAYAAAQVTVRAKLRVDAVEAGGVNFYLQDADSVNIARVNVINGVLSIVHGIEGSSANSRSTLVSGIDTQKFYEVELKLNYDNRTITAAVDGKTLLANVPFFPAGSTPATAPAKILFGANQGSTAKLIVDSLTVTADRAELSDSEACRIDAEAITLEKTEISEDFDVKQFGANGTDVVWTSSNDDVLYFDNGKACVIRPDASDGDCEVTITASVTRGVTTATKSFTLTVQCIQDNEAVKTALAKVSIPNSDAITSDIDLPSEGIYGVSFSWKSSDTSVVSDTGKVSRSNLTADKSLTLTLTAAKNSKETTKKFPITVKAGKTVTTGGGSGGSGSKGSGGGIKSTGGSAISVSNTVVATPEPKVTFTDLEGYEWAKDSIEEFYNAGYVSGVGDGTFEPGRNVTREEFVTVLVKALGLYDASAECSFDDLDASHWSYKYVASAVAAKAVFGIDENTFGTGAPITRQDMCVILLRALNSVGCTVKTNGTKEAFGDEDEISAYAVTAVNKLAAAEVISGMGDNMFLPNETATRAQMVRVIYAASMAKIAGSDDLSVPETTPEPTVAPLTGGGKTVVNVDVDYNGDQKDKQSRLPYDGAAENAVAAYNTVANRKAKALEIYFKTPSVPLWTGAWSDAAYGFAALWANDNLEEGNACIMDLCTNFPPEAGTQSSDSYFCMNLLMRCWFSFSDKSKLYPGRLTPETQAAIEKYFYDYLQINSDLSTAYVMPEDKMYIQDSENHDIVQRSSYLIGAELLLNTDTYKDRSIGTVTLTEFRDTWQTYLKYYFNMKARYGLTVETGSPTYSKYTVDSMYSIYDFTSDAQLKKLVEKYLDVYYTDAVLETVNGIRGSSKNRAYQDKYSYTPAMDAINFYQYIQFGTGDYMYSTYSAHPAQLCACATDYVAPFVLFDLAHNKTNDGSFLYSSQTMGAGSRGTVGEYNALNYEMHLPGQVLRRTFVTDDYAISSQTTDRSYNYTEINSQNKWMGVSFAGGYRNGRYDSRVLVQGIGAAQNGRTGYNEINGICTEDALLVMGLPEATNSNGIRIYISQDIFDAKIIEDGWLVSEDPDGNCYVAIKPSKGEFQSFEEGLGGMMATVTNFYVPVVIQVAKKSDYADVSAFAAAVKKCTFKWSGNTFTYETLSDDIIEMSTEKKLPKVNTQEIQTAPEWLVSAPFFNSKYGSGVFEIVDTKGHKFNVDFN